jgi:hypothetical protein
MVKAIQIGNGTIQAKREDFINGFQAGHLVYVAAKKLHPEPYSDEYVVSLFLDKLEDMRFSSAYGIGFAVGWLNTLASEGKKA